MFYSEIFVLFCFIFALKKGLGCSNDIICYVLISKKRKCIHSALTLWSDSWFFIWAIYGCREVDSLPLLASNLQNSKIQMIILDINSLLPKEEDTSSSRRKFVVQLPAINLQHCSMQVLQESLLIHE